MRIPNPNNNNKLKKKTPNSSYPIELWEGKINRIYAIVKLISHISDYEEDGLRILIYGKLKQSKLKVDQREIDLGKIKEGNLSP